MRDLCTICAPETASGELKLSTRQDDVGDDHDDDDDYDDDDAYHILHNGSMGISPQLCLDFPDNHSNTIRRQWNPSLLCKTVEPQLKTILMINKHNHSLILKSQPVLLSNIIINKVSLSSL